MIILILKIITTIISSKKLNKYYKIYYYDINIPVSTTPITTIITTITITTKFTIPIAEYKKSLLQLSTKWSQIQEQTTYDCEQQLYTLNQHHHFLQQYTI